MATITEKIDGRKLATDLLGDVTGTRVFLVRQAQNVRAAQIAFGTSQDTLVFPDDPRLELVGYDVESVGGSVLYTITARYAYQGIFAGFDLSWSYAKVDAKVPMVAPTFVTTSTGVFARNPDTGQLEPEILAVLAYGYENVTIMERRPRRIIRTRVRIGDPLPPPAPGEPAPRRLDSINELDIIAKQDGKIHLIFGGLWQFIGGDVVPDGRDSNLYTITYTWEFDEGTPRPPGGAPLRVVAPNGTTTYSVDGVLLPNEDLDDQDPDRLWRPPYSVPYIYSSDATRRPVYKSINPFGVDEYGWRGLPGMPQQ